MSKLGTLPLSCWTRTAVVVVKKSLGRGQHSLLSSANPEFCNLVYSRATCEYILFLPQYHSAAQTEGKKNLLLEGQDGGGVGGHGIHLSPWIHQEYTFRHRSACRIPAESRQEYLTREKEYIEPRKLRRRKELGGKTVSRTGPPLSGLNNWSRGPIPTAGQRSESEEKHLRLRVKQLTYGSLNGMRIRQYLPQPHIPRTRMQVSWKVQQLGAEV